MGYMLLWNSVNYNSAKENHWERERQPSFIKRYQSTRVQRLQQQKEITIA